MSFRYQLTVLFATFTLLFATSATSLEIVFDYSYDTNNFFDEINHPERRIALEHAADYFTRFRDNLAPITPSQEMNLHQVYFSDPDNYSGPFDVYSTSFKHPASGATVFGTGIAVPENTIVVYAGGRDIEGSTLGRGGAGTTFNFIIEPFETHLKARGQGAISDVQGVTATETSLWGGSLTFDTHNPSGDPREWYFGTSGTPPLGQKDFVSVALHEIGHLLGFSHQSPPAVINAYTNLTIGGAFTGASSMALNNGNPIPLSGDLSHFAEDLTSPVGDPNGTPTVMDPTLNSLNNQSEVKRMTELDYAVFDDIGWDIAFAGDANLDGIVNIADLSRLASNFGMTGKTWVQADFNHDGMVNIVDLSKLASNFNRSQNGAQNIGSASVIPEPSAMISLLALIGLAANRRR